MATTIDASTFAELQAAAGNDFVGELIDTFLEEAPPMLAELNDALGAGRAEPFRRAAHSLKSNASTFGALTLAAMRATSSCKASRRRRLPRWARSPSTTTRWPPT